MSPGKERTIMEVNSGIYNCRKWYVVGALKY